MYLNKAFIIGNLVRDPEKKALPSGTPVVNFSIATTKIYKDKNGVRQEDTQYHNIVAFGAQAETIALYMKKGSSILVEGRLQTRSWDTPDGVKKYRTEIIVDAFQFGPKPSGTGTGQGGGYEAGNSNSSANQSAPAKSSANQPPELETIQYPEEEINPDDIPF